MSNRSVFVLMLCLLLLQSCQKDDLCTTDQPSSARLIIVFTDATNPNNRKEVSQLEIIDGMRSLALPLDNTNATTLTAVDSIALPLPLMGNSANYELIATSNGMANTDLIDWQFNIKDEYVNRACGYRATYDGLNGEVTNEMNNENWISSLLIRNSVVNSNTDIHVEIRH